MNYIQQKTTKVARQKLSKALSLMVRRKHKHVLSNEASKIPTSVEIGFPDAIRMKGEGRNNNHMNGEDEINPRITDPKPVIGCYCMEPVLLTSRIHEK